MFVWESSSTGIGPMSAHPTSTATIVADTPTAITPNRTLWFGKAIPRVWLSTGEILAVEGASARGGARRPRTPFQAISPGGAEGRRSGAGM